MKKTLPALKISFKDLCNQHMDQLLGKLNNTPTDNKNACAINRVAGQLEKKRDETRKLFQDSILDKFALKDDKGKIKFNEIGIAEPDPARMEEYNEAVKKFEEGEVELQVAPLKPSHLVDVKLTAKEIGLLGDFFSEKEGPGIPEAHLHLT